MHSVRLLALLSVFFASVAQAEWTYSQMVTQENGQPVYHGKPIDDDLRNRWPAELEAEFQARARTILRAQVADGLPRGNTFFENEKRTYGYLMAHALAGDSEAAIAKLQERDHQHEQWHRETDGIDYYACFTLKHQMRKYFYFGDLLAPEYKKQMFSGAQKWTAKDPMRRPHYAFEKGKQGWGPDARNSWVDIRSTENLYLMRVTSVYLMAEETGNQTTTAKYKQEILDYTATLYRVGIGEWDSENYHGHSIAPLLNLYDFAQDREVKKAAKACLDFFAAAGAVKYWRGGFNGPTKRDYNHAQPFGGSAANSLWVWFGDHPSGKQDHWESDEVHQITSQYRPPLAVVHLARKQFDKPVEVFAAKPPYSATTSHQFDAKPEYSETQYLAHSFQMGSLTGGTSVDGGDVNGFKILAWDQKEGAVALHASPTDNPLMVGSPMYQTGVVAAPNRVAQQKNIALWLTENGKSPWIWVVPNSVQVHRDGERTILECDKTWVSIRPLGCTPLEIDTQLTDVLKGSKKSRFPNHQVLSCRGISDKFCGIAVEVGEKQSHGSFDQFRQAAKAAEVDTSELDRGVARYKSTEGTWLGIHWNDDPLDLGVWRNGSRRDLSSLPLYESPIIESPWGEGTLAVHCGGETFRCSVSETGAVTFEP